MLGIRLESALQDKLDRFAAATHRTRSDIAREAMREYLDRHMLDDEFRRQVAIARSMPDQDDLDWVDAAITDLFRAIEEEEARAESARETPV